MVLWRDVSVSASDVQYATDDVTNASAAAAEAATGGVEKWFNVPQKAVEAMYKDFKEQGQN